MDFVGDVQITVWGVRGEMRCLGSLSAFLFVLVLKAFPSMRYIYFLLCSCFLCALLSNLCLHVLQRKA